LLVVGCWVVGCWVVGGFALKVASASKLRRLLAKKTASFLFHGVRLSLPQCQLVESQLQEQYKNVIRMREDMIKHFSDYSGADLANVAELMVDGTAILSAQEALVKGIIHDIRDPVMPAGVQVTAIGNS
jgi:ATP-dependent protease ClpP protease subunit